MHQKVKKISILAIIKGVLAGAILGLVFIVASVWLLIWNEGNSLKTYEMLKEGASKVIEVSSEQVDVQNNGKLIHISGLAETEEILSDEKFGITFKGIALNRIVEMYQWKEEEKGKKRTYIKKESDGSEKKITTQEVKYIKEWSARHIDSRSFAEDGHKNPTQWRFRNIRNFSKNVNVGAYQLSRSQIYKINNYKEYKPNNYDSFPDYKGKAPLVDGPYAFYGDNPHDPQIGDIRISFEVVSPTDVSIVAQQRDEKLVTYKTSNDNKIEILHLGVKPASSMFKKEQSSNSTKTWLFRLLGTFLMFLGYKFLFGFIFAIAGIFPFFGNIERFGKGVISILISISLSSVVIATGWLYYRPLVGVGIIAGGFGLSFLLFKMLENKDNHPSKKGSNNNHKKSKKNKPQFKEKKSSNVESKSFPSKDEGMDINLDDEMGKYAQVSKASNIDSKYYIYGKGKKFGPFKVDEINAYVAKGQVSLKTTCKEVDGEKKIYVADIPGVKKVG